MTPARDELAARLRAELAAAADDAARLAARERYLAAMDALVERELAAEEALAALWRDPHEED